MGSTHIALTLANFLHSKLGMKTAYIELNTTNQIAALTLQQGKPSFVYKGVVFYPNTTVTSLPKILQKEYRYFILDMGVLNKYTITEFLRCDKQFLICSPGKWKLSSAKEKIEHLFNHQPKKSCMQLIMNLSEKESHLTIFSNAIKTIPFPYLPNPFQLKSEQFNAISLLLKNL